MHSVSVNRQVEEIEALLLGGKSVHADTDESPTSVLDVTEVVDHAQQEIDGSSSSLGAIPTRELKGRQKVSEGLTNLQVMPGYYLPLYGRRLTVFGCLTVCLSVRPCICPSIRLSVFVWMYVFTVY